MRPQNRFINVGGDHQHTNYFQKLIEQYFPKMLGANEINVRFLKKPPVRGVASEKEATAMISSPEGDIKHISLHHDDYNALLIDITGPKEVARNVFIASNKHNACPLILIRNKITSETATIMWHLSYSDLHPMAAHVSSPVNCYLPKHLREGQIVDRFRSLAEALTNPDAEILVTNRELFSGERLETAGQRKLLLLPEELHIVSSGLEGNIRSYSAIYFPVEDKLIISGDDRCDTPHLWLMASPFSGQAKWQKFTVSELEGVAEDLSRIEHIDMRQISLLDVMDAILNARVQQEVVANNALSSATSGSWQPTFLKKVPSCPDLSSRARQDEPPAKLERKLTP